MELNLKIDENNLMAEWRGQAALMLDYGIQLADAQQEEDELRAELSVIAAELDAKIRREPEAYDITKATESAVSNAVVADTEHKEAVAALDRAKHRVRILKAAVDAISHRKSSLQGMTDLFLRQWYADPRSSEQPSELKEAANGTPTKPMKVMVTRRQRVQED